MGVDLTAVARTVGIETAFVNLRGDSVVLLPQRVAVVGQGATSVTYPLTPATFLSALAVANVYGFGSPLHLAAKELLPINGDGLGVIPMTIYPLDDATGTTASVGELLAAGTASATGSFSIVINGISTAPFVISNGDTPTVIALSMKTAIDAQTDMPVTGVATIGALALTAKWKGVSGDSIRLSVLGDLAAVGVTIGITDPTGGVGNPPVQPALDNIVSIWETMLVNCMEGTDTTSLDSYDVWGEGRWGALVKKPALVFTGSTESVVATLTAAGDLRRTDRTNATVQAPGSTSLPLQIAARAVSRMAVLANNNPPHDYGGQSLTGIVPGADVDQWDYPEQDQLVKAGISTSELRDGVVTMLDSVTYYHPTGEDPPAYRYVVDIVKLQQIIFNIDLIFNSASWDGAPLLPDIDITTNKTARSPKDAVTAINTMIDALGLLAILSDPKTAKTRTTAAIGVSNPKRLDVSLTVQLSGNANVISVDLFFGFFFGTATAA